MNITKSASILDWRTNTQGTWTALVSDIAPSTQDISFSNGYTATVTNRKVSLSNSSRPTGTVTYEVEDVANTAYAGNLAAVGTVKDTLDVVTGEKNVKMGSVDLGTLTWRYSNNLFRVNLSGLSGSGNNDVKANILCSVYTTQSWNAINSIDKSVALARDGSQLVAHDSEYTDPSVFKTAMSGVYLYYELAEPTSSETTPQPLSLAAGSNTASMTDTTTGDKPVFPMSYDGTDYAIAAKSARVYLKDVDGTVERVTGVSSFSVRGGRDNVMDLTRMFGSGLEPGTLDAFYSLFPTWRGYKLPYNAGSLLNFKGTGLKSVGFNLVDFGGRTLGAPQNTAVGSTRVRGVFDETKYYVGFNYTNYYNPSKVTSYAVSSGSVTVRSSDNSYGVAFPIRAIPGQTYRFENLASRWFISYYTYDGHHISYTTGQSSTAPSNAYWGLVLVVPTTNNTDFTWTDPCVHLQWSGTRNGDYEPYWDYTRPVPTLTYFPDGMNGRGNVYDEINDRQAIRRFGVVDLVTLNWTAPGTYTYWYSSGISSIVRKASSSAQMVPIISSLYTPCAPNDVIALNKNSIAISTSGSILVYNGSTTEPPTGWLVYELATPVVTTFSEEISTTARISDFGTEECLPANGYVPTTAPFRGLVLYQDDYARTITKLPENYQSQNSMDNLLALLGSLHNGTFTATFDSANQVYTYQFTPNE